MPAYESENSSKLAWFWGHPCVIQVQAPFSWRVQWFLGQKNNHTIALDLFFRCLFTDSTMVNHHWCCTNIWDHIYHLFIQRANPSLQHANPSLLNWLYNSFFWVAYLRPFLKGERAANFDIQGHRNWGSVVFGPQKTYQANTVHLSRYLNVYIGCPWCLVTGL